MHCHAWVRLKKLEVQPHPLRSSSGWPLSCGKRCPDQMLNWSQNFSSFMFQWPEQNALLESANWEIPGYARGVKHVLVHDGKVMFAQTKIDESPKEGSSNEKSKNEEAMDQYIEAWKIGDMRHCLSVLVEIFKYLKKTFMWSFSSRTQAILLAGFPQLQFRRMRSTNFSSSSGCRWFKWIFMLHSKTTFWKAPAKETLRNRLFRLPEREVLMWRVRISSGRQMWWERRSIESLESDANPNSPPQWVEQDALIESANWEIPGFAKGIYHVLVHNGKVMWEQAIVGSGWYQIHQNLLISTCLDSKV